MISQWSLVVICLCFQFHFYNTSSINEEKININLHQTQGRSKDVLSEQFSEDFIPVLNEFSSHSIIRPQIVHNRHKRALSSTLDPENGLHEPHITLSYHHGGRHIIADLKRNDDLLPSEHFLRYQNSQTPNGHVLKNFTKTELDLCHYRGTIRGKLNSNIAISTCNGGINGFVFDGTETYYIHSGSDSNLHDDHLLLRHTDKLNKNLTCGYNSETDDYLKFYSPDELKTSPNKDKSTVNNRILRYKRSDDDNLVIRGPYNADKRSSYVELVIVVDNKVYKSFGESTKKVHQHCKDLANIINALYVPLNIFIALIGVVIWNESNEIEFSTDGDVTLRHFLNYRRTKLVLEHPNDNAQLLTKEQFNGGVVGKALKGPICTHEYSGGVSMEHSPTIAVVATTMAHEMGHNFGMEHDSTDCQCQDEKCIMSASSTSVVPVHWSSCSIDQLNIAFSRGMNYCLRNKPTKLFESPQCGNGFVEPGEQCDCGLPNYCKNTCCDPNTCMLHSNASCATGECCDLNTCRPKVAGTVCRQAENECDLSEYCTGESEYCPIDVFKRDTQECDNGQAFCYQGNCRSHSNQCRILWGPTGESSQHCYWKNKEGKRGGNCGYNRINSTYIPCETDHVDCGMLHCRHLNERLEFGMESAAVLSHSFINHDGNIVACRTALVDLGLQSTDPGLTPNGAKCGDNKMCLNQKCRTLDDLHAVGMGKTCPENCNGYGVCNSRGNCHCNVGYTGATCLLPGPGGSIDSGPASNPNSHKAFQRFLYIFFFAIVPCVAALCIGLYYCRINPFIIRNKLTENMMKSTGNGKQSGSRSANSNNPNAGSSSANSLPKSTPSSTDDMNSALLKSPSESVSNGSMFGKFKGFTLRPLNDSSTPSGGPNVAYVQPTVQDSVGVPQRIAPPPPPTVSVKGEISKLNSLKSERVQNATDSTAASASAPALPPPNPGCTSRPIISLPVLEASTLSLPLKSMNTNVERTPIRAAPLPPGADTNIGTLKPAPPPPIPLHSDPKLNVKRDGTIRRIASFLKKEDKQPIKEKTYIDREKLRNIEISAPMPVSNAVESSDSDTISPSEEEAKNLVKRAQSMRSPTKKTNIQSFGSMRYPGNTARPKSIVANNSARPKSPPPRPPPVLKKTNSTTSSGYQMPLATSKSIAENTYDDCEFVEIPITNDQTHSSSPGDNIYSVIDEIPPASQTLKRSDLVSVGESNNTSDLGLLGEIVTEIEKRNGDSIYSGSTLTNPSLNKQLESSESTEPPTNSNNMQLKTMNENDSTDATASDSSKTCAVPLNTIASSYLRATPAHTPVARVAPTRSDAPPTTAFSSFKPGANVGRNVPAATTKPTVAQPTRFGKGAGTGTGSGITNTTRNKSIGDKAIIGAKPSKPGIGATASIQKPKPISAKPSFSTQKSTSGLSSTSVRAPHVVPVIKATATPTPAATSATKSNTVASLSRRFESGAAEASKPNTDST